ncbi:phosphopentomutase [candidate division WOR-3 bacterium]|nr:phosphopentomutase [candidate division WOR-3 bacterium]
MKRVIITLLDGVGCGELPDAEKYGDKGSNTLGNLSRELGGLKLPNLETLGLGNIIPIKGVSPTKSPRASYGKAAELSPGKDSTTGHWEIMGLIVNKPFPTYPEGFSKTMLEKFQSAINRPALGGWPASGTQIIEELGKEHLKTKYPIVYTSADSVFQIAAHKDVIPLQELYKMCETARKLFPSLGRIIARPFIGKPGNFKRTPERKDFSIPPPDLTLLDLLKNKNLPVITIGKIDYLFAERGITQIIHTKNNNDGMEKILEVMDQIKNGLLFANLVDFDTVWGHRNNKQGFAQGLRKFDDWLPNLLEKLKPDDILFIIADHGCDPTTPSTDHSREYIPILIYGEKINKGVNIGTRKSFSDIGATIGEYFGIKIKNGKSFLPSVFKKGYVSNFV